MAGFTSRTTPHIRFGSVAAPGEAGWFWPMYIAGSLERGNVRQYDNAAACAGMLSLTKYEKVLRRMCEVERGHESYFAEVIADHWLLPVLRTASG